MQDAAPLTPPPAPWNDPSLGVISGTIRRHTRLHRARTDWGRVPHVYTLDQGFVPQDRKWIQHVQPLGISKDSKVLYRPEIVECIEPPMKGGIFKYLVNAPLWKGGLVVTGPPGVGKSYSVLNLTRKLLASNNYVVTVIPDCRKWNDKDVFNVLLESVGIDPGHTGLHYDEINDKHNEKLIREIHKVLSEDGMDWVFVFDQIDDVSALDSFKSFRDLITRVDLGRVISTISVSAYHDVWYHEDYKEFEVFEHPMQLHEDEIRVLYPPREVAQWDWEELEYATGRVPWYLSRWTKEADYVGKVCGEIVDSLDTLRKNDKDDSWKDIVNSAIHCVLRSQLTDTPRQWNHKFSTVQKKQSAEGNFHYTIIALFPLVEEVYRDYFWDDLCGYTMSEK